MVKTRSKYANCSGVTLDLLRLPDGAVVDNVVVGAFPGDGNPVAAVPTSYVAKVDDRGRMLDAPGLV